jgi:hypothetical protein
MFNTTINHKGQTITVGSIASAREYYRDDTKEFGTSRKIGNNLNTFTATDIKIRWFRNCEGYTIREMYVDDQLVMAIAFVPVLQDGGSRKSQWEDDNSWSTTISIPDETQPEAFFRRSSIGYNSASTENAIHWLKCDQFYIRDDGRIKQYYALKVA